MKSGLMFVGVMFLLGATASRETNWPQAYKVANGELKLRAILTPDSSTAEDNTNAAGGNAVQYAFNGGEYVCIQSAEAAYIQFNVASASMTAGAAGLVVPANAAPICRFLANGTVKISGLCVTGSCTRIAISEGQ